MFLLFGTLLRGGNLRGLHLCIFTSCFECAILLYLCETRWKGVNLHVLALSRVNWSQVEHLSSSIQQPWFVMHRNTCNTRGTSKTQVDVLFLVDNKGITFPLKKIMGKAREIKLNYRESNTLMSCRTLWILSRTQKSVTMIGLT